MKSIFDANGRFNPAFHPNSESIIFGDTVILAIGQSSDFSWIRPEDGLTVTPRGTIQIDPETMQTTADGIFAGGRVVLSPRNVIEAVADGRRAAIGIDTHLRKIRRPVVPRVKVRVFPSKTYRPPEDFDRIARQKVPIQPIDRRIGVSEVELGYSEAQAQREARRCLRCWINTIFDSAGEEQSECILCGGCVDVCPENCLTLSSFDEGSIMLKDETRCLRCALCERRCPTGAITMEAFECEEALNVQ